MPVPRAKLRGSRILFQFFETGFLCVVLAVLELPLQAGFELGDLPASASQVLGLKACATIHLALDWRLM